MSLVTWYSGPKVINLNLIKQFGQEEFRRSQNRTYFWGGLLTGKACKESFGGTGGVLSLGLGSDLMGVHR